MELSLCMLLVSGVMVLGALASEDYYGSAGWSYKKDKYEYPDKEPKCPDYSYKNQYGCKAGYCYAYSYPEADYCYEKEYGWCYTAYPYEASKYDKVKCNYDWECCPSWKCYAEYGDDKCYYEYEPKTYWDAGSYAYSKGPYGQYWPKKTSDGY